MTYLLKGKIQVIIIFNLIWKTITCMNSHTIQRKTAWTDIFINFCSYFTFILSISLKISLKKKHVYSDATHSNYQKQFKNVKKVHSVYWTFLINFHLTNNSKNRTHGDEEWKWSHTEWKFIPPRRTKTRSQGWCLTIGLETKKHLIISVFINYMHAEISLSNCMGNIC